jgi:NADH-quinone oxidoreductase subunit M
VVAVIATSGVVLSAVYMLWMYRRVVFGPVEHAENRKLIDLGLREKFVMVAILVPIFWIGVYPETFLSRIRPSVIELVDRVEKARRPQAPPEQALSEPSAPNAAGGVREAAS